MYRFDRPSDSYSPEAARAAIRRALAAAAELRRDTDELPRVDADGSSECPFAERLHFDKEKTAQFVRDDLDNLQYLLKTCTSVANNMQTDIDELACKRESLNGESAQDQFAKAELELTARLQIHRQVRQDLIDAISEVNATLHEGRTKPYPGGEPRGPYGEQLNRQPRAAEPIEKIEKANTKRAVDQALRHTRQL